MNDYQATTFAQGAEMYAPIRPLTVDEERVAALFVCEKAETAAEARTFLDMLGLRGRFA